MNAGGAFGGGKFAGGNLGGGNDSGGGATGGVFSPDEKSGKETIVGGEGGLGNSGELNSPELCS